MEFTDLVALIGTRRRAAARPIVVGISGYGGAGKSTLARRIVAALPDALRIRGDDFLDPKRSHARSSDWDGVERTRLVNEVLAPFRDGRPSEFRRFDWSTRALGSPESLPAAEYLVVDLIGFFHPDALDHLDVAVWCDVDLETAAAQGRARDKALGRDHDQLWHEIWVPNDRDFAARFSPRDQASLLFRAT